MAYIVTKSFRDLTDNDRLYKVGDKYPAKGEKPTKARIRELLNGTNKNGKVYLKEVPDEVPAAPAAEQTGGEAKVED
jgi:hypothetical protein